MGSLKDFTLKTFDFLDRSSKEFEKEKFENNEDDQRSKKVRFPSVPSGHVRGSIRWSDPIRWSKIVSVAPDTRIDIEADLKKL